MIVNKYGNGGGGSASGVTPEQVQQEIQSALTPYWESGETKDYVDEAVSGLATEQYVQDALSGVDLTNYWTSAETEEAISAATAGKADAQNVTANINFQTFARWNSQGVITGQGNRVQEKSFDINGNRFNPLSFETTEFPRIWAPQSAGTAGDILVSAGNGAPVWSSVTMPDTEEIELPIAAAVNKLKGDFEVRLDQQYYKKQETNNLLKEKVTAGQVDIQIKNYTDPLFQAVYETIEDKELPISAALNDLNTNKVSGVGITKIQRMSQAEYDLITTKDPNTFYIIVNN